MTFSKETLEFFLSLLENVQMPVSHPDFEKNALVVIRAKQELEKAMGEAE